MDPKTKELTRKLEEMGETKTDEGLTKTYTELRSAIEALIHELVIYRKKMTSCQTCAN